MLAALNVTCATGATDDDGHVMMVTAAQAAGYLGVPTATVRSWHERGHLKPIGPRGTGRGRPWSYAWADVLAAERATRAADPAHHRARELVKRQEATLARDSGCEA